MGKFREHRVGTCAMQEVTREEYEMIQSSETIKMGGTGLAGRDGGVEACLRTALYGTCGERYPDGFLFFVCPRDGEGIFFESRSEFKSIRDYNQDSSGIHWKFRFRV